MTTNAQYSDAVIAGMQMLYGEGFLSPGGAGEVAQLLAGFDPTGLKVLDIGCGLGGCAVMLVRDHGAAHVTGLDIEPELVARATSTVDGAGLQDRINVQQVTPGSLPLDDHSFDLVLTKDVVCHMPDKTAVMSDIFRVLKPGGSYLCADFFDPSQDPATTPDARVFYDNYVASMAAYGLTFHFESRSVYEQAMRSSGFELHDVRDHTALSAEVAERELEILTGDTADVIKAALGDERFANRVSASTMRHKALETRGLLHDHIHARRPAKPS